jgi:hypothetical protein
MTQPTFADQIALLDSTLRAIEARMAQGDMPAGELADFKSSVDDMRLRLWDLLGAGSANDFRSFQERFRLKRAQEICRALEADLRHGAVSPRHDELNPLGDAARALARAVDEVGAGER